eukprot:TRINITY_DN9188_c0_g3_i1.p1 TRINITY_DN9188_c0_g3~~TRINITY_DN9188_c0_g3_i1.p1  ORF type:complete len:584 (-),score=114.11 TRINITY_DN9188_c0_g3_i1:262-2013(-)
MPPLGCVVAATHGEGGDHHHHGGSRTSIGEAAADLFQMSGDSGKGEEKPQEVYTGVRKVLADLIATHAFEGGIGLVIVFNMCTVVIETNNIHRPDAEDQVAWIEYVNNVLLAIYIVELALKLFVFRLSFFFDAWNCVDFLVVAFDVVLIIISLIQGALPQVSIFRIFRLLRLMRAFKAAKMLKELNLLIRGFLGAVRVIFWGLVMISLILVVFSILAVQVIHPINKEIAETTDIYQGCDRCPHAYETVWDSCLTFFQQVVAGDSWGTVSVPIAAAAPWTMGFFVLVLVVVNLAMLNLILAVIVEAAQSAKEEDDALMADQVVSRMEAAKVSLLKLCEDMDKDKSGYLTIEELKSGYEESTEFAKLLNLMDIHKNDLGLIFQVLDYDGSGDVNYHEFVDQLHRIKTQTNHVILYYVTELRAQLLKVEDRLGVRDKSTAHHSERTHSERPPTNGVEVTNGAADLLASLNGELAASFEAAAGYVAKIQEDMKLETVIANERCNQHTKTLNAISESLSRIVQYGVADAAKKSTAVVRPDYLRGVAVESGGPPAGNAVAMEVKSPSSYGNASPRGDRSGSETEKVAEV